MQLAKAEKIQSDTLEDIKGLFYGLIPIIIGAIVH